MTARHDKLLESMESLSKEMDMRNGLNNEYD